MAGTPPVGANSPPAPPSPSAPPAASAPVAGGIWQSPGAPPPATPAPQVAGISGPTVKVGDLEFDAYLDAAVDAVKGVLHSALEALKTLDVALRAPEWPTDLQGRVMHFSDFLQHPDLKGLVGPAGADGNLQASTDLHTLTDLSKLLPRAESDPDAKLLALQLWTSLSPSTRAQVSTAFARSFLDHNAMP